MIGDGMGFEQMQTTLFYNGNSDNNIWIDFPVQLAAATFNAGISYDPHLAWKEKDYVMSGYTESAAAATAIATGHKTKVNHIGISEQGVPLTNLIQLATLHSKSTGVVTSVPFNHATPAGFTAHNPSRLNYGEIAREMILFSHATVIMGCGHPEYDNNGFKQDFQNFKYLYDERVWEALTDQKSEYLIDGVRFCVQDIDGDLIPDPWTFSDRKSDLYDIVNQQYQPKRLFFLAPAFETLSQLRDGQSDVPFDIPVNSNIPSLSEMSMAALSLLNQDEDGFFLMIEGGAIDWACHDNDLVRLIEEQTEFEKTISTVIQWLHDNKLWNETLLIVLADHECGYLSGGFDDNLGFLHISDNGAKNLPGVQFLSTDHTNHLVPFFARGFGSHVFSLMTDGFDPVRGKYLHIRDVAKAVQYFWGDEAFASPSLTIAEKEQRITITVSAPWDVCNYKWNVNGKFIDGYNSPYFEFVFRDNTQIFCELNCNTIKLKTNLVHVIAETK